MSDDNKTTNPPKKIFLKEVRGGVSQELGETSLREGFKPSKPAHLKAPNPVAVPSPIVQSAGNSLGKGEKPSKPSTVQQPTPVAVPPSDSPGGKQGGQK
jgi:hypothetical protein